MARIEKYMGDDFINIDEKVGVKGRNVINDVLVIQALLKYYSLSPYKWTNAYLPEPNGILDFNTQKAIFDFQQLVRTRNAGLWVSKDGAISPYQKNVKLLNKQEWTIISLNNHCSMFHIAGQLDGKDHVDAICQRWSQVNFALGRYVPFF